MVDVSFLVLVFLAMTLRSTALESKLDAYLPSDVGIGGWCGPPQESVDVRIDARPADPGATSSRRVVEYTVGGRVLHDLKDVRERLEAFREGALDLRLVLDPRGGVRHQDVVHILDIAVELKLRRVRFKPWRGE